MKRILLLPIICLLLTSCAESAVPVQILADACLNEIRGAENLGEASEDYLRYCMGDSLSDFEEYILLYPFAGTAYKEIGVFKRRADVSDKAATNALCKYLQFRKDNWDTRYKGDEFAKIESARVLAKGRYYLITVLDENERAAVERTFRKNA